MQLCICKDINFSETSMFFQRLLKADVPHSVDSVKILNALTIF
jgi:hypothetical protein